MAHERRKIEKQVVNRLRKAYPNRNVHDLVFILSWKDFARESTTPNGIISQYLDSNLNCQTSGWTNYDVRSNSCLHTLFSSTSEFVQLLVTTIQFDYDYEPFSTSYCDKHRKREMINYFINTINDSSLYTNNNSTYCLCYRCRIKIIFATNGFYNWIKHFYSQITSNNNINNNNAQMIRRYDGISLFNGILGYQSMMLRSILLNKKCYKMIFETFFAVLQPLIENKSMMDYTNKILDSQRDKNNYNYNCKEAYQYCVAFDYQFCCNNPNINICFHYENNLSSLIGLIISLFPFFQLEHIRYFIKLGFPSKLNTFLLHYLKSNHLEKYIQSKTRQMMQIGFYHSRKSDKKFKQWQKLVNNDPKMAKQWNLKHPKTNEPLFIRDSRFNPGALAKSKLLHNLPPILFNLRIIIEFLIDKINIYHKKFTKYLSKKDHDNDCKDLFNAYNELTNAKQEIHNLVIMQTEPVIKIWWLQCIDAVSQIKKFRKRHMNEIRCTTCCRLLCMRHESNFKTKNINKIKRAPKRAKKKIKFQFCKGCRVTAYCDKKCQKIDWNRNNHKTVCKQLQTCILS